MIDEDGLEGSRVPRVSDLTGLRRDATESIAVRSVEFDWGLEASKICKVEIFSDDEQILIWSSSQLIF